MEGLKRKKSEFGEPGVAEVSLSARRLKYNSACRMRGLLAPNSLLFTVFALPIKFCVVGRSTTTPNCHFPGRLPHPQPPSPLPNLANNGSYLRPPTQPPGWDWCLRPPTWPSILGLHDKYWCDHDHRPVRCWFHSFLHGQLGHAPDRLALHNRLPHVQNCYSSSTWYWR